MIRALNTGVLGMRQFQTSLDVIGNNLANINTVAYKGARVEFQDTLSQTLRAPTPDTATTSGAAGMQVGNGMAVSAIKNTFTQGAMKNTGVRTDMSVNGKGFFLVKDPTTNELFATRAGDFREDKNGYLVTNDGFRVQGKNKLAPAGANLFLPWTRKPSLVTRYPFLSSRKSPARVANSSLVVGSFTRKKPLPFTDISVRTPVFFMAPWVKVFLMADTAMPLPTCIPAAPEVVAVSGVGARRVWERVS